MLFMDKHIDDIKKTKGTIIKPVRYTAQGHKAFWLHVGCWLCSAVNLGDG